MSEPQDTQDKLEYVKTVKRKVTAKGLFGLGYSEYCCAIV